ncbi:ferredoxin--NADP reductase [Nocardia yamanashiensis]|uniref:ferredoxin--NADP reductase n=1 Tax=Nocardia yamanashiensis TaxID=209247 RepID=UPI001E4384FC|nr:ferredoxin--NADP reductase [Nocardia yamanashiensis]UGT41383.1 ferredoxin--NADP reductase [Nocardia yamanashiensis]
MSARAHRIKVREVVSETADAVSLIFDVPADLSGRFAYAPGQFLTVRVPSDRTGSVARCYSLSSSPHCDDRPAVTVKRTAGGYASNWLCDNVSAGSILTVLEPAGNFSPRSLDRDFLLCAAGSGITPIMSIAKSALTTGRGRVVVLYANRDRASIIFERQLRELTRRYPRRLVVLHWLESERGLPGTQGLATMLRPYRKYDVFLCGPEGFATVTTRALAYLRVPARAIHREEYRSLTDNPFERPVAVAPSELSNAAPPRREEPSVTANGAGTVRVEIDGSTHTLPWPRDRKLLDVLLDNGIDAPYVCRESACGTCVCRVREGRTRMLMNEALIDEEIAMGLTLACQTLPESDDVRIVFDQ